MSSVIPHAFAFHFAIPVKRLDALPRSGQQLLNLPDEFVIPWPDATLATGSACVKHADSTSVDLRMAWNRSGIGIAVAVRGKSVLPKSDPFNPTLSDGLQVWIDTRNTQTIHRASRFCHHLCLLPSSSAGDGRQPAVQQLAIARAAENAAIHPPTNFPIVRLQLSDGYLLETWLPASTLTGFDVEVCSQLGFTCLLRDRELGEIPFTVGSEFPVSSDPSLWQTLDLVAK